jgi:glycosyltransferase involved in cell wall biosynthesis
LNARKNIETLLTAIPFLKDQEIKIVIVGKQDWKTPNIKKFLLNDRILNRLIFTGSVTDDELVAIYAMASIFCFPSFAEGFGLPPLEAMASGVPVIVSNTTAMPEIGGSAACYFNPTDARGLAFSIDKLLTNDSFYEEKRTQCIIHSSNFTWEQTAHLLMQSVMRAILK